MEQSVHHSASTRSATTHDDDSGFPWRSANTVENYPRVSRNFSAQMTIFPTGSGSLSRTYFRSRWKETCGGRRTSRGEVHGSLRDLGRQPFSDTEINLNSFSYQSPIAPEAPNHVGVGVSSAARPFGRKFAWKSSRDARDYPMTRRKNNVCAWTARPDERWIYWFLDEHRLSDTFSTVRKKRCKKMSLKNTFVLQNRNFTAFLFGDLKIFVNVKYENPL